MLAYRRMPWQPRRRARLSSALAARVRAPQCPAHTARCTSQTLFGASPSLAGWPCHDPEIRHSVFNAAGMWGPAGACRRGGEGGGDGEGKGSWGGGVGADWRRLIASLSSRRSRI
jgi:hypothetical protein